MGAALNRSLAVAAPQRDLRLADIPKLEELRTAWFDAPDQAVQKEICRQMQAVAWETVPYIPTGLVYQPTAYRKSLTGVLRGFPLFYNVRRSA